MEIMSEVGLALIIVAFAVIILGAVKDRPQVRLAGNAANALGCAVVAVHDGITGSWASMTLFVALALANVCVCYFTHRTEARRATA